MFYKEDFSTPVARVCIAGDCNPIEYIYVRSVYHYVLFVSTGVILLARRHAYSRHFE